MSDDTAALRDRLAVLHRIQAQAIHAIGSLTLERGGRQLTDPDDLFIVEQWSILSQSAEAESAGILDELAKREITRRRLQAVVEQQYADARLAEETYRRERDDRRRDRNERLTQCAYIRKNGRRCEHRFSETFFSKTLCHNHREFGPHLPPRPYEGWPTKEEAAISKPEDEFKESVPNEPSHKPWREWRSIVDDVAPVVPVRSLSEGDHYSDHIIADTIDKRARAIMACDPPWARRARHRSRRYEGFSRR